MDEKFNANENAENATPKAPATPAPSIDFGDTISLRRSLSSPLMVAINVLLTLIFAFNLIFSSDFNVFYLLAFIAGWVIYGQAKKGSSFEGGLKFGNFVAKFYYIVMYVAAGFLFIGGLILALMSILMPQAINEVSSEIYESGYFTYGSLKISVGSIPTGIIKQIAEVLGVAVSEVFSIIMMIFGFALMFGAICMLVINIVFTRKISLFVGSLKNNANNPVVTKNDILKANASRIWIMIVGIFTAIISFRGLIPISKAIIYEGAPAGMFAQIIGSSFSTFITGGVVAAAYIVLSVWIGKYFVNTERK